MNAKYDETLEGILRMFREDGALFVIIETLLEEAPEVDEVLEDWR
jgi:hypothetical protein